MEFASFPASARVLLVKPQPFERPIEHRKASDLYNCALWTPGSLNLFKEGMSATCSSLNEIEPALDAGEALIHLPDGGVQTIEPATELVELSIETADRLLQAVHSIV